MQFPEALDPISEESREAFEYLADLCYSRGIGDNKDSVSLMLVCSAFELWKTKYAYTYDIEDSSIYVRSDGTLDTTFNEAVELELDWWKKFTDGVKDFELPPINREALETLTPSAITIQDLILEFKG